MAETIDQLNGKMEPLFPALTGDSDDSGVSKIESLCLSCYKQVTCCYLFYMVCIALRLEYAVRILQCFVEYYIYIEFHSKQLGISVNRLMKFCLLCRNVMFVVNYMHIGAVFKHVFQLSFL